MPRDCRGTRPEHVGSTSVRGVSCRAQGADSGPLRGGVSRRAPGRHSGVARGGRRPSFGHGATVSAGPDHLASWHARSTHDLVPHRFRRLVAICRHVPGLPTQLRRWGRRRRRGYRGIRSRLPYIRSLGVDAIWLNPWYPSPMADAGYDIADYRAIDPLFGTLAEAEAFIAEARALGLRVLLDIVPNHMSSEHPWFRAALATGPGSQRAGALPVSTRTWRRHAASERLGERLRWVRLDADPRARREAGGVVPAPLRPRAAGPELD